MSHFRPRQHNLFQSTPPVRGATELAAAAAIITTISIHAPRAGGDDKDLLKALVAKISIHAPRAGGDRVRNVLALRIDIISIHAPRAGGDAVG